MKGHVKHPHRKLQGLDPGIAHAVEALRRHGVRTFESCQGGPTHAFAEPTVCFEGDRSEGFRALQITRWPGVRRRIGLEPRELCRVWRITDGEATGPEWRLVWRPKSTSDKVARAARLVGDEAQSSDRPSTHCPCDRRGACSSSCGDKDRLPSRQQRQPRSSRTSPDSPFRDPSEGDA